MAGLLIFLFKKKICYRITFFISVIIFQSLSVPFSNFAAVLFYVLPRGFRAGLDSDTGQSRFSFAGLVTGPLSKK
jgi:hypothetical protein